MRDSSASIRQMRRQLVLIIIALIVMVGVLRFWPALTVIDRMELRTVDWRFMRRGAREPQAEIVIVHVDEASIGRIGRWPWSREVFAEIVRTLTDAGAAAIVFDIFFAERDTAAEGQRADSALVQATADSGIVYHAAFGHAPDGLAGGEVSDALAARSWSGARIMPATGLNAAATIFTIGEITPPLPELIEASRGIGFVNVVDSGDGVYRQVFPLVLHEGSLYPSLSVSVASGIFGVEPGSVVVRPGHSINLGGLRSIPIDRSGRMLVDFAGPSETFEYIAVNDLFDTAREAPEELEQQLDGAIAFVAVSAPGLYDLRASPYDTVYNGVETQANALANILEGLFLREAPGEVALLVLLLLGLVMHLGLSRLRSSGAVGFAAAIFVGYNWLALALFDRGFVIDMVAPNLLMVGAVVAALALRLSGEETEHERVRSALSRFVPGAVMDRVVADDPADLLRGHRRVISVMFADLRNFTSQSEQMDPEQTVELLNRFFFLVQETIWEFEGTLDKYMGDGLMAFWNSPLDQAEHALLAVRTAVHMQRRIQYNRAEWEYLGMPDLAVGIGISTGEAVVGYVGTGERMQYTAIGAHVNLASRLEAMTKELGRPILITESTWEQVAHATECRPLGPLEIRGFSEPVKIYEVLDLKDD
ncbi:MAG: adenylate/guanylate cyclase domain-containing protein [candidate division WS1 bacterium]|jgi:adenylate cyclase|nr:adenylate/guanylate cyclase domain-containing protein [candidate division WS1 bacterium]